ncbi:uncharacterized protein N7496_008929 [Penicillium cataractarum]|uniref:Uncharacterized protein n=1 Tax=Penicillium cataractarum TaxID=2100454 RepID=A0A9W9S211_9EURO|nr:uncharacterized protein N7496_008929 [Penicillium cataractarum]KAJ5369169.1 hypothetical protein N7496_008929 [Penicillium cataractarum]
MGKAKVAPREIERRHALTPPLPPSSQITKDYHQRASTLAQSDRASSSYPKNYTTRHTGTFPSGEDRSSSVSASGLEEDLSLISTSSLRRTWRKTGSQCIPGFGLTLPVAGGKSSGFWYTKATEILYAENTFYFSGGIRPPQFIQILPPAQLNTTRHITLECPEYLSYNDRASGLLWREMINAATQLKGLRAATVILSPRREDSREVDDLEVLRGARFAGLKIFNVQKCPVWEPAAAQAVAEASTQAATAEETARLPDKIETLGDNKLALVPDKLNFPYTSAFTKLPCFLSKVTIFSQVVLLHRRLSLAE